MSRIANDIKKRPQKGLKIVCSVLGCAFALLSIFVPFSGLKSVKADYVEYNGENLKEYFGLVKREFRGHLSGVAGSGADYVIDSLSPSLVINKDNLDSSYFLQSTNIKSFEIAIGEYSNFAVGSSGFTTQFNLDGQAINVNYYFDTFIFSDSCQYSFDFGRLPLVPSLWQIPHLRNVSDIGYDCTVKCEIFTIERDDIKFYNFEKSFILGGPLGSDVGTFLYLLYADLKPYAYEGYVYFNSFNVFINSGTEDLLKLSYYVPLSFLNKDNVSVYEYSNSSAILARDRLKIEYLNNLGIEDIFSSLLNSVSDFFNTEFIPGFRLWYFLLIGLGCAIVGIALKFFLGG